MAQVYGEYYISAKNAEVRRKTGTNFARTLTTILCCSIISADNAYDRSKFHRKKVIKWNGCYFKN